MASKPEQIGRKGWKRGKSGKRIKRDSHRLWRRQARRNLEDAPTRRLYRGYWD